jgi:ribosomal protein L21E
MAFKEGDRVVINTREITEDDVKSGLYYAHYRGLTGVVQKVYDTVEEMVITVDDGSLSDSVRTRHYEVRDAMKQKWLDGLSEEAKGRLSEAERDFRLRYSVLVAISDVSHTDLEAPAIPSAEASTAPEPVPHRKTAAEIEAEEAAYLASKQQEA